MQYARRLVPVPSDIDVRTVPEQELADGDLVALHAHWTGLINKNGDVGIDVFRLKDGKLVEHCDVIQEIPDKWKMATRCSDTSAVVPRRCLR